MKKFIKVIIIIIVALTGLVVGHVVLNKVKDNTDLTIEETIEKQLIDTISIGKEDENIIAYITISEIGLEKAPVADGIENRVINKYIGHFKETAYLDGNICLCAHNRGFKASYFEKLNEINKGDKILYETKYKTKTFIVDEIKEIQETDLSVLNPTENNIITLITCVKNKSNLRLCVIGVEE